MRNLFWLADPDFPHKRKWASRRFRICKMKCVNSHIMATIIVALMIAINITHNVYVQGTVRHNHVQYINRTIHGRRTIHDKPLLPIHRYNIAVRADPVTLKKRPQPHSRFLGSRIHYSQSPY